MGATPHDTDLHWIVVRCVPRGLNGHGSSCTWRQGERQQLKQSRYDTVLDAQKAIQQGLADARALGITIPEPQPVALPIKSGKRQALWVWPWNAL